MANAADQKRVDRFIKALVGQVASRFTKDIDFVILYGSAARSEFIPGVSDIDLLFQVKSDSAVSKVLAFATKVFWKENKRFRLGFEKSCSISKPKNIAGLVFNRLENSLNLYTPLFVFGPNDFDWEHGRVRKKGLAMQAHIVISEATVFHKFKTEGKIYYGRDIRKAIRPHFTWWESWKAILIPQHIITFAVLISPIFPVNATRYCTKAILYGADSAIMYLKALQKMPLKRKLKLLKTASNISLSRKQASGLIQVSISAKMRLIKEKDFGIIDEALRYKTTGFPKERKTAVRYALRGLWFIIQINTSVILHRILNSIKASQK